MTLALVKPNTLAEEIQHAYHDLQAAWGKTRDHAIHLGELLYEAHLIINHGEWTDWLATNFPGSHSTATDYIRLAEAQRSQPEVLEALPDKLISTALKAIARPQPAPAPRQRPETPEPAETYVLTVEQLSDLVRSFGGQADPEHVRRWIERLTEPKMGLCPDCHAPVIHAIVNGQPITASRYEWQPKCVCSKCLQTRHAHPGRPVSCPHCNSTGFTGVAKRPPGRMLAMDMAWSDTPHVRVIGERTDRREGEALYELHICPKAEAA